MPRTQQEAVTDGHRRDGDGSDGHGSDGHGSDGPGSDGPGSDGDDTDPWAPVRDLPPSAKLVAKVLEYDGSATQRQLARETLLPTRTVRYALTRLEDVGVVESRISFTDARKRIYTLTLESTP